MKQLLTNYTNYNHWANQRVCKIIEKSDPEILDIELKSSFTSVRKTLYHIWDSETIWYKRLNGSSLQKWPSENFKGNFDEFIWQFLANSLLIHTFVIGKSYNELLAVLEYKSMAGTKFKNSTAGIIQHCVNHSSFHRGQIYTMLRTLGITGLQSIDYITFLRDNNID